MLEYATTLNAAIKSIAGLKDEFKDIKANIDNTLAEYQAVIDKQNQRVDEIHVIKDSQTLFKVYL